MKDLGPYPSGGTITMVNYANFNKKCVDSSLTMFMQYSPFLLLMEVTPMVDSFHQLGQMSVKLFYFDENIWKILLGDQKLMICNLACPDNTEI
jgi:hypothetical protein